LWGPIPDISRNIRLDGIEGLQMRAELL